ncbi:hypothetical protein JHW43_002736 [Diplocarpon mali]|nr:hypothetical protein JHW43_002736 [Diplocarpon mali]
MFWPGSGLVRYAPLSSPARADGHAGPRYAHVWQQCQRHVLRKRLVVGVLASLALLCLLYPSEGTLHLAVPAENLRTQAKSGFEGQPRRFRLLIPATQSNANLCKSILTASIVNFTAPFLINWGREYPDDSLKANGTHLAKITGILEYLDALRNEFEYDHVLIVDGYDTWFQFGPEVIEARYAQINRQLLERTRAMMGPRAFEAEGITQSILFSAQKDCGPRTRLDDVGCYGQLESTLPTTLYGDTTDLLDPRLNLPLHGRSHFLCSGVIMGTVQSLRRMFVRASEQIDVVEHHGSDQAIFNVIYGEQSYQREVMRLRHRSLRARMRDGLLGLLGLLPPSITDKHASRRPVAALAGAPREFGIGIDFGLEISHSLVLSQFDGRWLTLSDAADARAQQTGAGVDPPRVTGVPSDVTAGPLPFFALPEQKGEARGQQVGDWDEVSLYSNLYTGSMPAIIHFNGHSAKPLREHGWGNMWYHREMRAMLSALDHDVGAWSDKGEWLPWDTLCRGTEAEVFRDVWGPWKQTQHGRRSPEDALGFQVLTWTRRRGILDPDVSVDGGAGNARGTGMVTEAATRVLLEWCEIGTKDLAALERVRQRGHLFVRGNASEYVTSPDGSDTVRHPWRGGWRDASSDLQPHGGRGF